MDPEDDETSGRHRSDPQAERAASLGRAESGGPRPPSGRHRSDPGAGLPPWKRRKRWLVYLLARAAAAPWSLLPLGLALALGRLIGRLAHPLAWSARKTACTQLEQALGVAPAEAPRRCRALFVHVGALAAELICLPRLLPRLADYVALDDASRAALHAAVAEGRGVVMVTAHLGNWELLAQRVVAEGLDGVTVARENPNPYLSRWLGSRRGLAGLEVIDRGDPRSARRILAALKRGAILGLLIDQDTRVQSTFVPFFGRPARTPIAAAQLALRRDCPVLMAFIHRRPEGGHQLEVSRLPLDDLPEGPAEARVQALTARMTAAIEAAVRARPEQWVWFHRRWRTPPPS